MKNKSEDIKELITALSKFQGEVSTALKNSSNPFHKNKYADLNSVIDAYKEPLYKNGMCISQTLSSNEIGDPVLVTTLMHVSGQWIESVSPLPVKEEVSSPEAKKKVFKNDPQALGSSITYMRRYSVSAILGLATESDDDGEKAMKRNAKKNEEEEKILAEQEERRIAEQEGKMLIDFIAQYPEENEADIGTFFSTLKDAWKKPYTHIIEKYRDHDKFMNDFGKWKEKKAKK